MSINLKALRETEDQLWSMELKLVAAAVRSRVLGAEDGAKFIELKEKVRALRNQLDAAK